MNRPNIPDIGKALLIYYGKMELATADIIELFGCCRTTATRMKKTAQAIQLEREIPFWDETKVNTECAFEAWGINIADLERRHNKLLKLKEALT